MTTAQRRKMSRDISTRMKNYWAKYRAEKAAGKTAPAKRASTPRRARAANATTEIIVETGQVLVTKNGSGYRVWEAV